MFVVLGEIIVMGKSSDLKFSNAVLMVPLVGVLLIWTVFWVEVQWGINLNPYGIYPRSLRGLAGVAFSPFIHSTISHLYHNTIPLAVLLAALTYFYRPLMIPVLLWGTLATGLLTWGIGRPAHHIGASGVIYLLASFIFFKGILTKHFRLVALSLGVVFLYGSMLWYIFPVDEALSWEGHLSGFLVGLVLAIVLKTVVPPVKKYSWEREDYDPESDAFLKHFDADGNFIEEVREEEGEKPPTVQINYHYKKSED